MDMTRSMFMRLKREISFAQPNVSQHATSRPGHRLCSRHIDANDSTKSCRLELRVAYFSRSFAWKFPSGYVASLYRYLNTTNALEEISSVSSFDATSFVNGNKPLTSTNLRIGHFNPACSPFNRTPPFSRFTRPPPQSFSVFPLTLSFPAHDGRDSVCADHSGVASVHRNLQCRSQKRLIRAVLA